MRRLLIAMGPSDGRFPRNFQSGPRGSPTGPDGPSVACACKDDLLGEHMRWGLQGQYMSDGLHGERMRLGSCGQDVASRTTMRTHGPQGPDAETWSQWTSQTDAVQQTPEWCRTCLRELLDTMGPSDGRSGEDFLKWSSRTACNLKGTTNGM